MREGMTNIVSLIRQYGFVEPDEITIGGVTYWTDNQLEALADTASIRTAIPLKPVQVDERFIYSLVCPRHYYAEDTTLSVYTASKTLVSVVHTYNHLKGELTFDEELDENTDYYLEASFTNLFQALADLWGQKASQRYNYISFKGGDNKMEMQQEFEHCKTQEKHYRNLIANRLPRRTSSRWSIS